jgi:hypothetical protein
MTHPSPDESIIYLAGPYSNDAPRDKYSASPADKRLARFNALTEAAKYLIEQGRVVYSPITMTHPIDIRLNNQPTSQFWVKFDESFMRHCSELCILTLPGWDYSSGVAREIQFFKNLGITANHLDPRTIGITPACPDFAKAFS